jgi:hypothetical protein
MSKFPIPHGTLWLRPDKAFFDYLDQAQKLGVSQDDIEFNGKYKRLREQRDLAVFGLALYGVYGKVFLVQLNDQDPSPDGFLMTPDEDHELTASLKPVEMTFYGHSQRGLPKDTLLTRLTAKKGKFNKLPNKYTLLIHIGPDIDVDHQSISDEMVRRNVKFDAFSIQEVVGMPDTTVRLVFYTPKYEEQLVNIGQAAVIIKGSGVAAKVTQIWGRPPEDQL